MTAPDNPLVAEPVRSGPSPGAGVAVLEDVREIHTAVRSREWVDATLAGAGGALDGLVLAVDPFGSLLQFGIAWLLEQVEPFAAALDWLAGDAARITAHVRTWNDVAAALTAEADGLAVAVRSEVAGWSGAAAGAYRVWAADREAELRMLGAAAGVVAAIAEGAGGLVGAVRLMVRDAIATVVARLVVYAAEVAATRGLALPVVIGQVTTLCTAWAARISDWLKALVDSVRRLLSRSDELNGLVDGARRAASRPGGENGGRSDPGGDTGRGSDPAGDREGRSAAAPARDFDAGSERRPLGGDFRSGVEDAEGLFVDKERAIADVLAAEGRMVHPRRRVDDVTGLSNPDAMVRAGPDDPGVVTEFKTLESASSGSVRANILTAGGQVGKHGGGDVVIDGRPSGLTEEVARQGFARAAGQARQHGSDMPEHVRVILADGTMLELP
ncbi:hypothetical protein [Actinoplanes utahensis]|uniref:hypothetical protein n=1 Tax=Actinoplanes utahensis TaxID=1869 RepID=UPI00068F568E|nr:hypothetical protein [Actinoplanes utahensis]GIF28183.1 hypothetical protein Aut01nite_11690 [Actinoplanes utahensis]